MADPLSLERHGPRRKRFRWSTMRWEWGHWGYRIGTVGPMAMPNPRWWVWEQ